MPTLFRMLMVVVILGGGAAAVLAVLGVVAEPEQREVRIDITNKLTGR